MNKFLVIGSNSFSGSHFVEYLIKKRQYVFAISRSSEINNVFLPYKWSKTKNKNFFFKKLDLNKDTTDIINLIKKHKINTIVNFASQSMVSQSWKAPLDWYKTNVISQVKLHDELRKINFLKRYVHVSTPEVYGSTKNKIKEKYNFAPSTPYAASRAACDLHLLTFYKNYNFPVVFTRASNVYGPGQQLYRIIPKAILCGVLKKKLHLHGGGNSCRSFIHIDDVVKATYLISKKGRIGQTYHIANNQEYKIKDVVKIISKKLNIPISKLVKNVADRPGKDQTYSVNSSKIYKEMNWEAKISLEMGVQETMEWLLKNIKVIKKLPDYYIHKK